MTPTPDVQAHNIRALLRQRMKTIILIAALLAAATLAFAQDPWPAEPLPSAVNLTEIEGSGVNDFYYDLSGAVWNPVTRTLWICRNGPGGDNSKLWAVVENDGGSFEIDYREGNRGEWTGFGDLEGVTQADFDEDVVYTIIEGEERIKAYDVSTYGTASLLNDWDTSAYLPRSGGAGAEGITFIPDSFLAEAGFVDSSGVPCASAGGMDGLMFVGHQNGGGVFVFDLDRTTDAFTFIGEYQSGYSELAGLEFDRSTGELYAWHDSGFDILSVFDLTSEEVPGEDYRSLNALRRYLGPSSENNEGIAVMSSDDCLEGERSFFMTVDDGGATSLLWYREFEDGCPTWVSVPDETSATASGIHIAAHPNPSRDTTMVSYQLAAISDVCLRVFDVAGREIRTLHLPNRPAGEHVVTWDGRNQKGDMVRSGVYLLRLEATDPGVGQGTTTPLGQGKATVIGRGKTTIVR